MILVEGIGDLAFLLQDVDGAEAVLGQVAQPDAPARGQKPAQRDVAGRVAARIDQDHVVELVRQPILAAQEVEVCALVRLKDVSVEEPGVAPPRRRPVAGKRGEAVREFLSRELAEANPSDYELRFALGMAHAERADAYLQFARAVRPSSREADLDAAERDYLTALDIYQKLQDAGTFAASDMTYVDNAREQLQKARAERAAGRRAED